MRQDRGGLGGGALVVGVLALCCGGPLLIGALLATGVGAWLLVSSGLVLGAGALLVATILGALWLRRRRWRPARTANRDYCEPVGPVCSEGKR